MADKAYIDQYIAKAEPFARPILRHIRAAVRRHCPDAEETKKWSFPHFLYKGRIMCSMAAFKAHCAFGFANGAEIAPARAGGKEAMGDFGRLASVDDLPSEKALAAMIRKQMKLIDGGVKMGSAVRDARPKPEAKVHPDLVKALAANPKAKATFDNFAPSHRREYADWISDAKRDETRAKRLATAIEWLVQGKKRNWKYENC